MRAVESNVRDAVVALNAGGFLNTLGNIGADFTENGDLALEDFFLGACGHVAGDVADEALAGLFVPDTFPQGAGSVEIFGTDFTQESYGVRGKIAVDFVKVDGAVLETDRFDGRQIIGARTLVVESHVTIALKVANAVAGSGCIDWELLVVNTDSVAVSVGVGKETRLQDWVSRWLDTWNHVGGIEGGLLDFGEVILGVFVEGELANFTEGELLMRPNVGKIEDVDLLLFPEFFGFFGGHGLPFHSPGGTFAAVNRSKEVLLGVVGRLRLRFLLCQELCTLLRFHVHLTVDPLAFLVDKLESVAGVSVHKAVTVRNAAVTHENHNLVDRLGVVREVIPEHCRAGQRLARSAED